MFETQKIDSFFSGEKNLLDEEVKIYTSRRTKVVRFFKLFLPCLTALLLGVGVILFDFEATSDSSISFAEEEKLYFEKFRIKNTVFEITEKDNRFTTLKAEIVEETEPNSKVYDLTNPKAETLDGEKLITVVADTGVYHQNTQILHLNGNIRADYDNDMVIKTASATYDFAKESGFGNDKISGSGEKGSFEADKFTFDKKNGVLTLIGHVRLDNKDAEMRTPDKATLFLNENKVVADNAVVQKGKDIIQGDVLTAFFKDTKTFEVIKAYSNGHTAILAQGKQAYASRGEYDATTGLVKLFEKVKVVDESSYTANADEGVFDNSKKVFTLRNNVTIHDKSGYTATALYGIYDLNKKTFTLEKNVHIEKGTNTITAPRAVYFQTKGEFRFYDDVTVTQEESIAKARSGVYYIKKNIAELEKDVIIIKNGNEVRGDKAISDLETSKSRLVATNGGRIFGKLIENASHKKTKGK